MALSPEKYFASLYDPAKNHIQALSSEWDDYEKAYLGEPEHEKPEGDDAWRSYIHFKYAWQQTQVFVAEVASEDDPTFVWTGRNPQQDKHADTVQAVVGEQLSVDDYPTKRYMSILTAAIYGGAPIKSHWLYDEHNGMVLEDRPENVLIDPRSFFYDPRARSTREWRYAGHSMRMELAELKSRKRADGTPLYQNLDQIKNGETSSTTDGILDNDHSGERDKARRKGVEVIELWTRDRLLVRAGNVIIRDEPNPYKDGRIPFDVVTILPSVNDVWGLSLMWALRDPQALIQSLDNAAMDQIKLSLDPPRAVDTTDYLDNAERKWYPGQVYPSRSPKDAVVPLRSSVVDPFTAQQSIIGVRDTVKEITGITDELAGSSNASSATEAALNQRQSKGRVGQTLKFVDAAWARIAQMMLRLNQQYLDLSVPIRIMGGPNETDWRHIGPSEIGGQWDVRPKASSERVVKELHRQNLMEAMNALGPHVGVTTPAGMTIDLTPFAQELAESFGFPKNRVIVSADLSRAQQQKDVLADAEAQAQAAQMMPAEPQAPEAPPEQAPSLVEQAQSKLFTSINYKDLPDSAQATLLEEVGLPSDGVEDDNRNPTRPNAGSAISTGLKEHAKAKKDANAPKT